MRIGIDLGGTKIEGLALADDGRELDRRRVAAPRGNYDDTVRDVSTFVDPTHYSQGIEHVLVNGVAVVSAGKITDGRPGQPIRGRGYRP